MKMRKKRPSILKRTKSDDNGPILVGKTKNDNVGFYSLTAYFIKYEPGLYELFF